MPTVSQRMQQNQIKLKRQKKSNNEQRKLRSEDSVVPYTRSDKMKRQIIHHARFLKNAPRSRANTLNDPLLRRSDNTLHLSTLPLQDQPRISIQRKNDPIKRICNSNLEIKPPMSPRLTKSSLKQKAYRAAQIKKEKEDKNRYKIPKRKPPDKVKAISLDTLQSPAPENLKKKVISESNDSIISDFVQGHDEKSKKSTEHQKNQNEDELSVEPKSYNLVADNISYTKDIEPSNCAQGISDKPNMT